MKGYIFRIAVLSLAIALGLAVSHPLGQFSDGAARAGMTSADTTS